MFMKVKGVNRKKGYGKCKEKNGFESRFKVKKLKVKWLKVKVEGYEIED